MTKPPHLMPEIDTVAPPGTLALQVLCAIDSYCGRPDTNNREALGVFVQTKLDEAAVLAQPPGSVVVTKDATGAIVLVSRQDDEGRILSVISEPGLTPEHENAIRAMRDAPGAPATVQYTTAQVRPDAHLAEVLGLLEAAFTCDAPKAEALAHCLARRLAATGNEKAAALLRMRLQGLVQHAREHPHEHGRQQDGVAARASQEEGLGQGGAAPGSTDTPPDPRVATRPAATNARAARPPGRRPQSPPSANHPGERGGQA